MGVSSYTPPVSALAPGGAADPDKLVIAPNGVAFLPQRVRPGVLPRLLHEILATRVMVKAAMKRCKADKVRGKSGHCCCCCCLRALLVCMFSETAAVRDRLNCAVPSLRMQKTLVMLTVAVMFAVFRCCSAV